MFELGLASFDLRRHEGDVDHELLNVAIVGSEGFLEVVERGGAVGRGLLFDEMMEEMANESSVAGGIAGDIVDDITRTGEAD